MTRLIHQPAHLVKEVREGSFPLPTSAQTKKKNARRSQKTCFSAVRAQTYLDKYLATPGPFSPQIVTTLRERRKTGGFNGLCAHGECCFNAFVIHWEGKSELALLMSERPPPTKQGDNARTKPVLFIFHAPFKTFFKKSMKNKSIGDVAMMPRAMGTMDSQFTQLLVYCLQVV